jgi:(1->4)-alpha-D-glucan 1-alpha-D-glucosylmutase
LRAPASTYRLQITSEFDLHAAARLLPYLHELGVDWVYLSPILEAEPGSTHGYDVVDPTRVDPTRGGPEGLAALSAEARRLGMGVLVDVVPNHVGVGSDANPWWADVLEHGPASAYASFFDVDWDAGGGRIRTGDDLNYRRFFTIETLAGVRVEDPDVFAATHGEIGRWFAEGLVDGLRVDHPDGLRDPAGYLEDLNDLTGGAYVLVEKILETGEELPVSWATAGTTGYDALGLVDRVLTDPAGEEPLTSLADRLGAPSDWHDLIHDTKRAVADTALHPEIRRVVRDLAGEPAGDRRPEAASLVDAVAELMACFPVYRSYLPEGRAHLDHAFADARRRRPDLTAAFDRVQPTLRDPRHPAARRFQQTSGMVMAKGVEDCAFYRYPRLTSLNEVGGDPSVFSVDVAGFHAAMVRRQAGRPQALTALTTHDTKRSEDTRARIAVLAEVPDEWAAALDELLTLAPLPDPAFGSLLWQAVLGAWSSPLDDEFRARLHAYAEKAMREAGDSTTWAAPDEAFEGAVHAAVDAAFDDERVGAVLSRLDDLVTVAGRSNALSAKALALAMPGVPDIYQGTELWDQSLVDPDNRRPVGFAHRAAVLAGEAEDAAWPKMALVLSVLSLRRERPDLFGSYSPVPVTGEAADHAIAFDRGGFVLVATRLPVGLGARGGWADTRLQLPRGSWTDLLTGATTDGALAELLEPYPVALLVRAE